MQEAERPPGTLLPRVMRFSGTKKQPRRTLRPSRSLICRFRRVPRNNARSPAIPSCSGSWRVPRDALRPLKRPVGAFCTLGPSGLYVHYIRTRRGCQGVGEQTSDHFGNPYYVLVPRSLASARINRRVSHLASAAPRHSCRLGLVQGLVPHTTIHPLVRPCPERSMGCHDGKNESLGAARVDNSSDRYPGCSHARCRRSPKSSHKLN